MKKSILAVLICSGLLVACSSSSSSNSSSSTTSSPQDSKPSIHSNADSNGSSNNSNTTDSSVIASDKQDINNVERKIKEALEPNLKKMGSYFSTGEDIGLNQLNLDGTVVQLLPTGISAGEFIKQNSDSYKKGSVISGFHYNPVRFGYVNHQMFAHGNASTSTEVPTTGEATYQGKVVALAVPMENGQIKTDQDAALVTGESNIKVNFANKEVNASFTNFETDGTTSYKIKDIQVNGSFERVNIKPEKMSYVKIKNDDDFKQGALQAHFYGTNAEAVAGTFHKQTDDNHYIEASFGANKK